VTSDQIAVFGILGMALVLFIWGRWRFDLVALVALLSSVLLGIVPAELAFAGLGHPAVITVACVLILSQALQNSGVLDQLSGRLMIATGQPWLHIAALSGLGLVLSGFMNNVGALALLMPVALRTAMASQRSPALILMPLSFGTILGGLMTLIGTPPNIIVASYRATITGEPFAMFDFAPVGVTVALAGLLFVSFIGWRLIPRERRGRRAREDLFEIRDYITETIVPEDSQLIGRPIQAIERLTEPNVMVVGLVRGERRILGRPWFERLQANDVLIIEADPSSMQKLLEKTGLTLTGHEDELSDLQSDDVGVIEAVVQPGSRLEGISAQQLALRASFGINLIAIAREGRAFKERLSRIAFRAGDVVLLQGEADSLHDAVAGLGLLPLAERGLRLGPRPEALRALLIFGAALAAVIFGVLPVHIAFAVGVAVCLLLRVVSMRKVYEIVDWPVIILLGAMIPIGAALESTGGTEVLASGLLNLAGDMSPTFILAALIIVTMTLSDLMNNAATAVVMAPIAASLAAQLGINQDAFLMAVAVGASCAFLTPIGHQNNILVMGPGGYKFSDYWRMGAPLELLIIIISVPLIEFVWPY
jgi:di/tricarboxylate transporter